MAAKVARWLAPLALAAVIAAIYLVVHHTLAPKHVTAQTTRTTTTAGPTRATTRAPTHRPPPRFYVVRSGDTLSEIAIRTRVSVSTLESLNPKVNPNALQTGQRLALTP